MLNNKKYTNVTFKRDWHTKVVSAYCYYWKDGKRCVDIHEIIQRYFFADPDLLLSTDVFKLEHGYKNIHGKDVMKVDPLEDFTPDDYKAFQEMYKGKIYESDVKAIDRWIWDMKPTFDKNVRKWYIDIELLRNDNGQYCSVQEASNKICAVTVYDSFCNKYFVFLLADKDEDIKKDNMSIYLFKSERELLNRLLIACEQLQPDMFTGWNADGFDMPYLINRMENLGIDYRRFSPMYSVRVTSKMYRGSLNSRAYIKGRGILDLMEISKQFWMGTDVGYSLEAISQKFLGRGKIKIGDIDKAYREDFWLLVDYNVMDVKLCVDLDKQEKLIEQMQAFQDVISINLEETPIASKLIYAYVKQHTDIVLTDSYEKEEFNLPGGFVLPTETGIFDNSVKYDFVSHYPSFMRSYNVSLDTVHTTKSKDYDGSNYIHFSCYYKWTNKKGGAEVILNPTELDKKRYEFFEVWFDKDRRGMLTKIVDELTDKRLGYKKIGNKALSTVFKRFINSIYGILGYKYSRMFSKPCAICVTLGSQYITKKHIEYIDKNKIGQMLLGDTDSFLCLLNKGYTIEDILKASEMIFEKLKVEHNLDKTYSKLELEAEIERIILFGVKKKYAQLINGKAKVKGLEMIRRDFPQAVKDFQITAIDKIFKNKKNDTNLTDIRNIKKMVEDKIKEAIKTNNPIYYSFPTVIKKPLDEYVSNTFEKKAIKNSGLKIVIGEQFYVIECKGNEANLAFKNKEELEKFKYIIDYDVVISKVFKNYKIFENLFIKQTKLGDFK